MKSQDLDWLAGVLDKGSYIGITKVKTRYTLQLKVQTTSEKLIKKLIKVSGCGKYIVLPGKRRPYYTWYLSPNEAKFVLELVLPHLKIKDKHAKIALKYTKTVGQKLTPRVRKQRENYRFQIAQLATRGPKSSLL